VLCVDTYLSTRDQILKRVFHPWALQDLLTGHGKPVRGRRISYDGLFALFTAWWPGTHAKTRFISILNCQRPIKWVRSWLSDSLVVSSPQKKHHGLRWLGHFLEHGSNPVHNENGESSPLQYSICYAVNGSKASKAKRIPRQGLPVWGLGVEVRTGPDLVTEPAWSIFKCPLDSHYRVKICLVSPQVGMIAEPRRLFENWEHRDDTSEWHLSVSLVNPVARENDLSVISLWRWIPWDWSWVSEHWCIRRQQNRHKR